MLNNQFTQKLKSMSYSRLNYINTSTPPSLIDDKWKSILIREEMTL